MSALFFHFLCNRLIIRYAFLCFFYTVGLIHDMFITCYFTAYKVTIFLGYNQKNSKKNRYFQFNGRHIVPPSKHLPFPLSLRYH